MAENSYRRRIKERYRRFSFISDIGGMKNALGEMRGLFLPEQPALNREAFSDNKGDAPDEGWFIRTIKEKVSNHPENAMEYPYYGEPVFKEACYRKVAASIKHCNKNYHIFIYGCGLCSTGVPCESGIPEFLQR